MPQREREQDDLDRSSDEPLKAVSMPALLGLNSLFVVAFTILEVVLVAVICYALGLRSQLVLIWVLVVPNILLGWLAVDALLKRMGMSRRGTTVEVRGRTVAHTRGRAADDDVLEVFYPKSRQPRLIVICLGYCLATTAFLVWVRLSESGEIGWGYGPITLVGTYAIGLWWEKDKPRVRADGEGVFAYPTGFDFRRRFVPWSEIATCEILTHYNTFGTPVLVQAALKNQAGRTLLTPDLLNVRFEDQERLVKYIRAKLPKSKADFLDF